MITTATFAKKDVVRVGAVTKNITTAILGFPNSCGVRWRLGKG